MRSLDREKLDQQQSQYMYNMTLVTNWIVLVFITFGICYEGICLILFVSFKMRD